MSRPVRVLLGVIVGALLALWAHPYSRPRLFAPLFAWGDLPELRSAPELLSGVDRLPEPRTLSDYSLWMEAAAQRALVRIATTEREWNALAEAARRAAKLDPTNAFWHQMQAVIALAQGRPQDAHAAWKTASARSMWDDGQTTRLLRLRDRIAARRGEGAWIAGAVAPLRTLYAARAIEAVAKDVAKTTPTTTAEGLARRYETLLNGRLLRDGARSMATAEVGMAMIELATYTSSLSSISSPRKLLLARVELYEALRTKYSQMAAEAADRAFRENDSWLGYPSSAEASKETNDLLVLAALSNGTGAWLLVSSLSGLLLMGAAGLLERSPLAALLRVPAVGVLAVGLAAFAYLDTRQVALSIAAAASFGFMAFAPKVVRSRPVLAFGPLHGLLSVLIGVLVTGAVALGLATNLSLGLATLGTIDLPAEVLGGRDPAASASILSLSLLAVMSAFYGLVHRVTPASVFVFTMRRVGVALAWVGLVVTVVAAPGLLLLDRHVAVQVKQRLENEPLVYYLGS